MTICGHFANCLGVPGWVISPLISIVFLKLCFRIFFLESRFRKRLPTMGSFWRAIQELVRELRACVYPSWWIVGKSIFLRILLSLHLSARLPTFYATNANFPFYKQRACWDSFELPTPAFLYTGGAHCLGPFQFNSVVDRTAEWFCIWWRFCQTPSPRLERIEWRKKNPPIKVFCLELWSHARVCGPLRAWIRCWFAQQGTISKSPPWRTGSRRVQWQIWIFRPRSLWKCLGHR